MATPIPVKPAKPPALPPLYSEGLVPEEWSRKDIVNLIYKGERSVKPLTMKNGAFYHPQGAYQVFEAPGGARIGLWAPDPDDLVTEDITLTAEQAKGLLKFDERNRKVPMQEGDVLKGRLKDLGNGNLERLRVFTIHPEETAQHWLRDEMSRHQTAYRLFTLEQGTLIRESATHWTSGGIVYQLIEAPRRRKKKKHGPLNLSAKPEEKLYDLFMTQAPGFGWRLGHQFQKLFTPKPWRMFKKFDYRLIHLSSLRATDLTLKQGEELVKRDFQRRAPLFIDGKSPYQLPLTFAKARRSFWMRNRLTRKMVHWKPFRKARAWMREYHARNWLLRAIYGAHQLSAKEIAITAGVLAVSSIGLGAVMRFAGFEVNPLLYLGRMTTKTVNKTRERIGEYNRVHEVEMSEESVEALYNTYAKNWNKHQVWGSRFNPARAMELEAIDHNRLRLDSSDEDEVLDHLPPEKMVHNYILSVLQGPPGSIASPFRIGKFGGIRVEEPNGLTVDHVVERDAAFARLDRAKAERGILPNAIVAEFNRSATPYVKVGYNPKRGGMFIEHQQQEKYEANLLTIALSSYPPEHRKPPAGKVRMVPGAKPEKKRTWYQNVLKQVFGENATKAIEETADETIEELGDEVVEMFKHGPKI